MYSFYLFRTQIYTDLRRKLFPQIIKCLTFNFRFSAKNKFKILIIRVHLRPIIKNYSFLFISRGNLCNLVVIFRNDFFLNIRSVSRSYGHDIRSSTVIGHFHFNIINVLNVFRREHRGSVSGIINLAPVHHDYSIGVSRS